MVTINPENNQHAVSFGVGTNRYEGICFIRDPNAPDVAECPNCQQHKQQEIDRQERKRLRREGLRRRMRPGSAVADGRRVLDAESVMRFFGATEETK